MLAMNVNVCGTDSVMQLAALGDDEWEVREKMLEGVNRKGETGDRLKGNSRPAEKQPGIQIIAHEGEGARWSARSISCDTKKGCYREEEEREWDCAPRVTGEPGVTLCCSTKPASLVADLHGEPRKASHAKSLPGCSRRPGSDRR